MNNVKTTQEYFNKTIDELLKIRNEQGYTKEECLLFDSGLEIVFFDNEKEMEKEKEEFDNYIRSKKYEIDNILKTINERIAVILI